MGRIIWSKKEMLHAALLGMARDLGPGTRMPTVANLCDTLSVSNSTLDPVLRELATQGAIVREHGRGIFVANSIHQRTIGIVFGGDIFSPGFSPFWSLLLQAVRQQATGCNVVPRAYLDISGSSAALGGQAQLVEDLEAKRVDGLLLLSPSYEYDEAAQLREYGVPLVVFGGRSPNWRVTHDFASFMRLTARELATQDCQRVALLSDQDGRPDLAKALHDVGTTGAQIADWSYETWAKVIPGAGTHENCAHQLTQQMIADAATTALPDALVSTEDTMTRGAITALQQAGLRPGHDIRIITAANTGSPLLDPYAASLSLLEFDPAESIRAALGMLDTLMNNGTVSENPILIAPRSVIDKEARLGPAK